MKKILFIVSILFISCVSTNVSIDPSQIDYKEIAYDDFVNSSDFVLSSNKGYKITNVFLKNKIQQKFYDYYTDEWITPRTIFKLNNDKELYATSDFVEEIYQTDPTWIERYNSIYRKGYTVYGNRIEALEEDALDWVYEKFNGHLTVFVYKQQGRYCIYKIEGVPSQEEIDTVKDEYAKSIGYKSFASIRYQGLLEAQDEEIRKNLRIYLLSGIPIPSLNIGDEIFIDEHTSFQLRIFNTKKIDDHYELIVGHYDSTSQKKYIYIISKKDLKGTYTLKYIGNADYSEYDFYGQEKVINTYVFELIN